MRTITCDCGETINLDARSASRFGTSAGGTDITKLISWECGNCGQEWYEKAKEPKEIPHE